MASGLVTLLSPMRPATPPARREALLQAGEDFLESITRGERRFDLAPPLVVRSKRQKNEVNLLPLTVFP
jgi:hypothetical protein